MKKIKYILILILILVFSPTYCSCEEIFASDFVKQLTGHLEYNDKDYNPNYIYLEPDTEKFINLTQPQKIKSSSMNLHKPDFQVYNSEIAKRSFFADQTRAIQSSSGSVSEKIGKFTIGTDYDSFVSDGEMNYITQFYTRIDSKRFALTIGVRQEGADFSEYTDKLIFAPEWKITDRISLLDVAKTDIRQSSQKNEVVLRFNPKIKKQSDVLFLEAAAGQTYREQQYVKSSLRFSAKYNF